MAERIEPQLRENGCDMSADQFRAFVDDIFVEHFSGYTVDEMLLNPKVAIEYCNAVRAQGAEFEQLPDHLILRSLIGQRKKGLKR